MAEIQLTINGVNESDEPASQNNVTAAATDQYFIPADPHIVLRCFNGGAAATMTVITPLTVDGNAVADKMIALPAGAGRTVGQWDPRVYGVDGRIQFTFAAANTQLTIEAYRL